ncbi:MAG TPA: translocation/assembly module TamB domain-containing protein [Chthoniobacterales bacterium]|jgi:autotransporter translocation and assembly factor TamB|nr:translocation/assembly module TamB domain-containing protein [Chthoniobacterales bacterium]
MSGKKKRPSRIRVVLICLLGIFVILLAFYQPILFGLVRIVAGQVAKSQAIDLDFEIHGSLFSDLFIEKLHLQPRPENNSLPLERLDAQRIGARYNVFNLLRKRYLDVVDILELKNIDVVVRHAPSPPPPPPQKPAGPLRLPVVLPKRIDVRNINLTVKNDAGDLQLKNFDLQFHQGETGYLACDTLRIPGIAVWNQLRAGLSYTQKELVLSDLALAPLLAVNRLYLDLSRSEQGTFRLGLDAKALEASVLANASYEQPEQGGILDASLKISGLKLAELQRLVPVSLTGTVREINVELKGDVNHLRSLSGRVAVAAEQVRYHNIGVDNANMVLTMNNGSGTILESVREGSNRMHANATFTLSDSLDSLIQKTVANIGLAASIPDPGKDVPGLKGPTIILGSIRIADGKAKSVVRTFASEISMTGALPGLAISAANAEVFGVANLPLASDMWSSVATVALGGGDKISYQDAHIGEVHLETDLIDGAKANGNVTVRSGGSRINVSTSIPLPTSSAGFEPKSVTGHVRFNINSITDFITQELIKGSLAANGDVQISGGQADGTIQASGSQLSYRGMNVQSLQIDTLLKDGNANFPKFQIDFDPDNSARISGSARLNEPFPFQAHGELTFKDLAVLNGFLQNMGAQPGIGGELYAQLSGDGDIHNPAGKLEVMGNGLKYRGFVIQNVAIGTGIKDSIATIQHCRLSLDPDNYVNLTGSVHISEPYVYEAGAQVRLPKLDLFNELLRGLGQPPGLSGGFNLDLTASGDAKNPTASVQARGDQIRYRGLAVEAIRAEAVAKDSEVKLDTCRIAFDANNHVDLTGTSRIADPFPYDVHGTIGLSELGVFNDFLENLGQPRDLAGALNGTLAGHGDAKNPGAEIRIAGDEIKYRGLLVQRADLESVLEQAKAVVKTFRLVLDQNNSIEFSGDVALADPNQYTAKGTVALNDLAAFSDLLKSFGQPGDLTGTLKVDLSGKGDAGNPGAQLSILGTQLKYRGVLVQRAEIESTINDWLANLHTCRFTLDANNSIDITAQAGLKAPNAYMTDGKIELNDLAVFGDLLKSLGQSGVVGGNLLIDWSGKGDLATVFPDAHLRVLGRSIKYRGLSVQRIDVAGDLLQRNLDLSSCKVVFDQKNFVDASGGAKIEDPYDYNANALVRFDDLGFLNELAKSFGQDLGLGGKFHASWTGKGPIKDQMGNVDVHAEQLRVKSVQGIKLDASGTYQGMNAEVPTFKIFSPYADLDASIRFTPQALEIPSLNLSKNGNAVIGNLKIPFDFRPDQKTPLALDQPVEVNIRADKIGLASLQPGKPQVTGTVGFQLQASKTLRDPLIELTATARDIRTTAVSNLSAAQGDLSVRLADKALGINGKVTQPDVHPLVLTGHIPIDLGQVLETGTLPENTPIQFALKWPSNNLAFIRKIVPDIKIIEGTADIDVDATGTLKRPEVGGHIRTVLSRFQAKTDTVPPISNFASTISFRQDHIQIDQLNGLAGGGPFSSTGSIDLKDGANPKFDLGLKGKQVLLTRSDGIIVRANFDLSVRGPLSGGEVNGKVGITDSRFFKDIDILPLNLPGRPPPQPPAAAPGPISVTTPPFNAWKFNIAVATDDPFLIQSNLARGRVSIRLQAGGTGANPSVTGDVLINRLVASLPFSKMEIDNGRIDFVPGANILDPTLNIIGRSTVRDYEVTLRIFGNVSKPTVLLDSSPPLAQGDILVLLATGSTTSEFAQNPSLLAGRATFIVLQQLFGKFFPSTNRADEQKEPFIDRFSVNIIPGRKTGEQEISTSFRLTKNWVIIGDFGGSSYQGRLKYLVRFR